MSASGLLIYLSINRPHYENIIYVFHGFFKPNSPAFINKVLVIELRDRRIELSLEFSPFILLL